MWIEGRAIYRTSPTAPARTVMIALDLRGLTIRTLAGEPVEHWPFRSLQRSKSGPLVLSRKEFTDRVEIQDPTTRAAFDAVLRTIPAENASPGRTVAISVLLVVGFLALATTGAVVGIRSLAATIAPMVPTEVVEFLDEASVPSALDALGTTQDAWCGRLDGQVALGRLVDRLALAGDAHTLKLTISVYRSSVPNAFALPGGTIIVTDTLIKRVRIPDAFAGVLAHEIGHVHHRHGVTAMLRESGLALALTLITGDGSGLAAGTVRLLVGAAYSREAETEADSFAVRALAAAGGNPRALGPFLMDLSEDEPKAGDLITLFATHPLSADRKQAIEDLAADSPMAVGPLISEEDWAAIRRLCD